MIFLEEQLERPGGNCSATARSMAGDRHAADAGSGAADARRAGRRHERIRARARPRSCSSEIIKNRSVIVIEHDMEFVESIAHRVTVLHQGKILAEGNME